MRSYVAYSYKKKASIRIGELILKETQTIMKFWDININFPIFILFLHVATQDAPLLYQDGGFKSSVTLFEPFHEKTGFLHMRKQRGNREADQRLCFRYTDNTIPVLPKYEISSL